MQSKEKIIIHGGIQDTITISHLIIFSSLSDSGLAPLQRCDVKVLHHRYSASQFPRSEATNSVLTMRNSVFFRVNF